MKVVVVYDNRRPEKLPLFSSELQKQGIKDYEIFPAIVLTHSVVESISESFKSVIRSAKENGDEEICIMEDDIIFSSPNGWQYFLENKPKEYSVYIGGNYLIDNRIEYKKPLIEIPEWVGNHIICVHKSYYDIWLNSDSTLHCDGIHKGKGKFYSVFPYVGFQRNGWSANNNAVQYWSSIMPKEFIYQ